MIFNISTLNTCQCKIFFWKMQNLLNTILISASLLHVYDDSWQVESFPSLIGSNHFSNIKAGTHLEIIEAPSYATEANAEPVGYKPNKKDIAELKRYLTLMGVGYLIPAGTKIQDPKKFTHLCSTIMDKIETRHGTKLKPMVSVLWYALFYRESLTIFSDCTLAFFLQIS